MKRSFAVFAAALIATGAIAQAQNASQAEITFWESVRDSKNPAELQAYLQTFPNGMFAPIARARLAALGANPPPAPATPLRRASPVAGVARTPLSPEARMPQAGETWVYKLSYPRLRGQWGQPEKPPAQYVVRVASVADGKITDQISIDGGTPSEVAQPVEPTLMPQGVSVFTPYLVAVRELKPGSLGRVAIHDPACGGAYGCRASARVSGTETVNVAAGQFLATRVIIEQSWWPGSGGMGTATLGRMNGGRTLTVWYVPELKRAVKFESRITVGDAPAVDPATFDLELISYQVK